MPDLSRHDHLASPSRIARIGGVDIAAVTMPEAVQAVLELAESGVTQLVVTPNVDHIVLVERDQEFAAAYSRAALRLADGAPIVLLSRLLGTPLPERVTGVDLTQALLAECERAGRTVFFFGGAPLSLDRAIAKIRADHPDLDIAGAVAPTVDLDAPSEDEKQALDELRRAAPGLLFVFLGTPKQEKWIVRRFEELPPTVVVGVGGTVDLIGGTIRRAPRWVQSIGFEWFWRLCLEPRRLFRRYVIQDSRFLVIVWRELLARYRRTS